MYQRRYQTLSGLAALVVKSSKIKDLDFPELMPDTPEQLARRTIDELLSAAGLEGTGLARVIKKVKQEDGSELEEVTYINSGQTPEDLLSSFRNSYNPRIVVTVDMIATGTDLKPLDVVFFMRDVRSLNYFEQMKGRGVRVVISDNEILCCTLVARLLSSSKR
jgi:hypothetical protein